MKRIFLLLFFSAALIFNIHVYAFPTSDIRPGGIAILEVTSNNNPHKPSVLYKSKPTLVVNHNGKWLAIIGISLNAKLGKHKIFVSENIQGKTRKSTKTFLVRKHKYRTQRLTIKNKNKVTPNKKSTKRIEREFILKNKLKNTFSNTPPHINFIRPTKGRDSGRFGLRRILNKKARNPHSGMDIAAPKGRKVKAVESGTVIFIGDLFFTGNAIYLDHGNGLISLYAHLSKFNVKKGQKVKRGDIIGRVGKTGRVTGAHLHWSVYLNGNAVDPSLFLPKK